MSNQTPNPRNVAERICDYLNTYMVFPDDAPLEDGDQAMSAALWAIQAWRFSDSFPMAPFTTPYLFANSLTPQSGKTLLIDLLEPITLNPERTVDMTKATLFRLIESVRPTMYIDEIDTFGGSKLEDMRGVLNGGYKHSGYVWRTQGKEMVKFRTFSPKFIGGIWKEGLLDDTVLSRCLFLNLRSAPLNDEGQPIGKDGRAREIYYSFLAEPVAEQITLEIQAFMAEWAAHFEQHIPKPIPGISSRSWEITMPLVQIAHEIDRQAKDRAHTFENRVREVLKRIFTPPPEKDTPDIAMLKGIRTAFDTSGADRMFTDDICRVLGEGWNGKLLGKRLTPLKVQSTNMTIRNRRARGFKRSDFEQLWNERGI